jgi:hypothetical protein
MVFKVGCGIYSNTIYVTSLIISACERGLVLVLSWQPPNQLNSSISFPTGLRVIWLSSFFSLHTSVFYFSFPNCRPIPILVPPPLAYRKLIERFTKHTTNLSLSLSLIKKENQTIELEMDSFCKVIENLEKISPGFKTERLFFINFNLSLIF